MLVAAVAAALARHVLAAAEAPSARREREEVERTLPHLVDLFAATLRAGSEPVSGLAQVCAALPGPGRRPAGAGRGAGPLGSRRRRGVVGRSPTTRSSPRWRGRWSARRCRARPSCRASSGSPTSSQRESLARAEDAARRVGVAAAIPLGACLLPAFMLLGVVPTVASLFGSVTP